MRRLRGRSRDPWHPLLRIAELRPVRTKPCRVVLPRSELLRVRGRAHELALACAVCLALDELVDDRRNLGVAAGTLQRAQLETQRRGVRAGFLAQRLQNGKRFARLTLLELQLGFEHQSRHGEALGLGVRPREHRLRCAELARVDRGTGTEQRRKPGRARNRQRLLGVLACATVSAFEQRDHRRVLFRAGAIALLLAPVCANFFGQREGPADDAEQQIADDEAADQQDDQQVERKLDAVGRRDEQRVTGRELGGERDGDRGGREQEKPEEDAHGTRAPTAPASPRRRGRVRGPVRGAARAAPRGCASGPAFRQASASPRAASATRGPPARASRARRSTA